MSHHLGLDVHDNGNYDTLRENMVITVEPGIYIPAGSPVDKKWWNIGVRIEDDVLINKNNYTLLSASAPREPVPRITRGELEAALSSAQPPALFEVRQRYAKCLVELAHRALQ